MRKPAAIGVRSEHDPERQRSCVLGDQIRVSAREPGGLLVGVLEFRQQRGRNTLREAKRLDAGGMGTAALLTVVGARVVYFEKLAGTNRILLWQLRQVEFEDAGRTNRTLI